MDMDIKDPEVYCLGKAAIMSEKLFNDTVYTLKYKLVSMANISVYLFTNRVFITYEKKHNCKPIVHMCSKATNGNHAMCSAHLHF